MPLNPDALGKKSSELVFPYSWKEAALYALGVGAKASSELDFLYEARGPKVLPTFAVIAAFPVAEELFAGIGGNLEGVVHGSQSLTLYKPLAPSGTLKTIGTVSGLYDLKRLAQAVITAETRDASGELVAKTDWTIIYRLDGGFGGSPPPRRSPLRAPDREADWRVEDSISKEQALLYRLNGDYNPLHADPAIGEKVGFGGPILHGLCTYGYIGRAVLSRECGNQPERFQSLSGDFRKPVWPGDTLIIEGWKEAEHIFLRASTQQRPTDFVFMGSATTHQR